MRRQNRRKKFEWKSLKASIQMKSDAVPRFWKPYHAALARKPAVEKAFADLETQGLLTPVRHSNWAAPIATPINMNGSIQVCCYFKVTVNPYLKMDISTAQDQ